MQNWHFAGCIRLMIFLLAVLAPALSGAMSAEQGDQVNLALRRTTDQLLRASGDDSTRIPPVVQVSDNTWHVKIERYFRYDTLPALLQASLEQYGITDPYQVAVRRCGNDTIDLGYHQRDFLRGTAVPCTNREEPDGCHYLEVTFLTPVVKEIETGPLTTGAIPIVLITLLAGTGAWFFFARKRSPGPSPSEDREQGWVTCGDSRLQMTSHILECNGTRVQLTYREAKLLNLFFENPGELLERDHIMNTVWGDEGVRVGRSVDMFVSRLRKKLKSDPTLGIVAVHGVGYRMLVQEMEQV